MAAFDYVQNLNDVALKPRLLRSLIKEHIPDENQQLRNSLVLSHVVSAIKTHELVTESVSQSDDNKKLIAKWKSSVDLWIDRVLMLISSKMPDKRWAGVCLLGVTCEGCSSERFLASHDAWFQKLLPHLQPAESHFVKVACCVSLSDLVTRLGEFPNMKRVGASLAAKLVQPVLKLINEDNSDMEAAISLLHIIMNVYPSSFQKVYDSTEAAIVTKIMSGNCSSSMLKKLAHCLSSLPKSSADKESWSLMVQKVLIAINVLLNDSFQGLEDETKTGETMRALVPPGTDPPTPLGGLTVFDISNKATRPERVSMRSISALMLCCSTMLTTSYPTKVKVTVGPLLMLVERVLMVDGSLPQTLYPTITAMQQEDVCLELPVLHSYSLDILSGMIKGAHSQLLPHGAHIIRIVTEYFTNCQYPDLRIKLYTIVKLMMLSMGVGLTMHIAEDVVKNASMDLDSVGDRGGPPSSDLETTQKKRKHGMSITSHENQPQTELSGKNVTQIPVKIAALEVLETLLTVGGALGSDSWRSNVDLQIITVAKDACKGGWPKPTNEINDSHNISSTWAEFQLASLRALLASVLSPGRFRPPFLPHSLKLFHKGAQEKGTKVAEFCAHALLCLEVLIHPRAIPLIDSASSVGYPINGVKNRFMDNDTYNSVPKHSLFPGNTSGNGPSETEFEKDELYEKWAEEDDINELPVTEKEHNTTAMGVTTLSSEKVVSNESPVGAKASNEDKGKGIRVETQPAKEVEVISQTVDFHAPENMETGDQDTKGKRLVLDWSGLLDSELGFGDNDDPMDEIPDIVDVEPDSDEDED
ncbi:uncharacterized protein [Rutidosis leptorrhynchoides]|uniref:uncharacterized protein n=1 Tax=Rutidosis leptorrhynchoides TaxID=125765 RepID=UPI003A99B5DE